jgi:hypothetical protein
VPQHGRKHLFFLGAGASVAAGAFAQVQGAGRIVIPTQATFWATLLRFCASSANRKLIESFLFRYFLGYGRTPGKLKSAKRWALLQAVDVEEVFTFVSERVRAPATSNQLRAYTKKVWEALVTEIGVVLGRFRPNTTTRAKYRALLSKHVRSRDAVVSFNYDTIFEHSLPTSRPWGYECIDSVTNRLRVLKPHGSTNWELAHNPIDQINVVSQPQRSLIVAPTHLKFVLPNSASATPSVSEISNSGYLDQSPKIKRIWEMMEREMRLARVLIFIGYSFPVADLYFSSVLRSVLAGREAKPDVVIVNPDALAIRNRLQARFPIGKILLYYDLEMFLQISRQQLALQLQK